jgi:hypothetical protein
VTWLLTARAFLSRVPWQVYAILALLAAWGVDRTVQYRSGYSDGRESVLTELRTAEAEAAQKALEAAATATQAGIERSERFDVEQQALRDAITEAERADRNALDALFD